MDTDRGSPNILSQSLVAQNFDYSVIDVIFTMILHYSFINEKTFKIKYNYKILVEKSTSIFLWEVEQC